MKKLLTAALVIAVVLTLTGLQTVQAEDRLVVAQNDEAVTLDPHGENDQYSNEVRVQIYETLVHLDNDMEAVPGLAEDWEQIDELTWDFHLREGVKFHNGNELTADDVKFTFDRLLDPDVAAPGAFILDFLEEVEVVDEYTIRLVTEEPFAPILHHLGHPVSAILNREAVEEAGDDYGTIEAVGTGPFEYVEWSTGDYILLERFEDYWGENARVQEVEMRPVPEDSVRAIELETGGVDMAYGIAPPDEDRLIEDPDIDLARYRSVYTNYIGFNCQEEPFDNIKVRRALSHAVDTSDIVEHVHGGQGVQAEGPISENIWGHNPDLERYEYDPEKAEELLAEAGYEDGFSVTLLASDDPQRIQSAEIVQAQLREVGVDVEVQILEFGDFLERTGYGEHDMFILGWGTITGDADYGLYATFHGDQFGHDGNRTFYANDRLDELLEKGRSVTDYEERRQIYHEAQEIIVDEAPWIFTINTEGIIGVGPTADNFVPHPAGNHDLSRVTLE